VYPDGILVGRLFALTRLNLKITNCLKVWFGHKQMRLSNVLEVVAREFNVICQTRKTP